MRKGMSRAEYDAMSEAERAEAKRKRGREATRRWRSKQSAERMRELYQRQAARRSPDQIYRRRKWHRWFGQNRAAHKMFTHAKTRAKKRGVPFDLAPEDVKIPAICPVLGIPLVRGVGKIHDGSPTLDRVVPEKGYVKGNVHVISHRANRLKNDGSLLELEAVIRWIKSL